MFLYLYRLLFGLALVAYSPFAIARSLLGKHRMGDLRGRMGWAPYPDLAGGVWIHAVSVGEVGVARSLAASLQRVLPERELGLSATTAAGREVAHKSAGSGIAVFAFPFDLEKPVEKAFERVRPGLVLLTETEIWPLFLDRARARGIPVALVNGRVTGRSYNRYRLAGRFFGRTLENISLFAMQTAEDAHRMIALGAPSSRVHVTGNIKYDQPSAGAFADAVRLQAARAGRPVFVAASTGEGEERLVLDAWRRVSPAPLLLLAPRRPERFDEVAQLVESQGLRLLRRSSRGSGLPPAAAAAELPDVYLLDSIGELASAYRGASLAFIGGSLVPTGGHNPIEAWAEGVAVVTGPHMEHFREITAAGKSRDILRMVADSSELSTAIRQAIADPGAAAVRGESARHFVAENRGAADSTASLVLPLLDAPKPAKAGAALR